MSTVQFDTVIAGFVEKLGGMNEAVDDLLDLVLCRGVRLGETHAHDQALKLDIAGRYGVGLQSLLCLSSWV